MTLNSQTRVIVATAAVLAVVDIACRVIPMTRANVLSQSGGVVTAQEFRLVDQYGNERATLTTDGNGEPSLQMIDRNNVVRAQLDTMENTPSLSLNDRFGDRRSYFGMDNDSGNGAIDMWDSNCSTVYSIEPQESAAGFTSAETVPTDVVPNGAIQIETR